MWRAATDHSLRYTGLGYHIKLLEHAYWHVDKCYSDLLSDKINPFYSFASLDTCVQWQNFNYSSVLFIFSVHKRHEERITRAEEIHINFLCYFLRE
jgi:hypothetical protein